jgi:hypothetical protein
MHANMPSMHLEKKNNSLKTAILVRKDWLTSTQTRNRIGLIIFSFFKHKTSFLHRSYKVVKTIGKKLFTEEQLLRTHKPLSITKKQLSGTKAFLN